MGHYFPYFRTEALLASAQANRMEAMARRESASSQPSSHTSGSSRYLQEDRDAVQDYSRCSPRSRTLEKRHMVYLTVKVENVRNLVERRCILRIKHVHQGSLSAAVVSLSDHRAA